MSETTAIILAAGTSSRMGNRNKLIALWKGEPIIKQVVQNVLKSGVKEIRLVTGFEKEKIEDTLIDYDVNTVHNLDFNSGMTSSIQTGVRATHSGVLICLGDMPAIETEIYNKVLPLSAEEKSIRIPVHKGRRGNPVYFSEHFRQELLAHAAPEGCKEVILANEAFVTEVKVESDHIFKDIDVPSDLKS